MSIVHIHHKRTRRYQNYVLFAIFGNFLLHYIKELTVQKTSERFIFLYNVHFYLKESAAHSFKNQSRNTVL